MKTRRAATRTIRRILLVFLSEPMFAALALAESRPATAVVGVRIERHAGVVIPGTSAALAVPSRAVASGQDHITAPGNGAARMIFSGESSGRSLVLAHHRIAGRTEVTAFEP